MAPPLSMAHGETSLDFDETSDSELGVTTEECVDPSVTMDSEDGAKRNPSGRMKTFLHDDDDSIWYGKNPEDDKRGPTRRKRDPRNPKEADGEGGDRSKRDPRNTSSYDEEVRHFIDYDPDMAALREQVISLINKSKKFKDPAILAGWL